MQHSAVVTDDEADPGGISPRSQSRVAAMRNAFSKNPPMESKVASPIRNQKTTLASSRPSFAAAAHRSPTKTPATSVLIANASRTPSHTSPYSQSSYKGTPKRFTPAPEPSSKSHLSSESDQLKQIRKNWDTSYVPRGNVADRIKAFAAFNQGSDQGADGVSLENTGRTNPALRKRRMIERQEEESRRVQKEDQTVNFTKHKQFKPHIDNSAGSEQLAKPKSGYKPVTRASGPSETQSPKKSYRQWKKPTSSTGTMSKQEMEHRSKMATKMQAFVRSALTRNRMCKMVDEMIAELMKEQERQEKEQQEHLDEIQATEAARMAKEQAEADRLAQAAEARRNREAAMDEEATAAEAARSTKAQADADRLAAGASAKAQREQAASEAEAADWTAKELAEAERLKLLLTEKARKRELASERERRKQRQTFVGPLPWGVALLPDWWLENVPHEVLFLESITEDSNGGEDFETWRKGNMSNPIY